MDNHCPNCQKPYGKRRRCYFCNGPKKKTGETLNCAQCGKEFYAAQWQLRDTVRRQGTYCSRACLHESMRLKGPGAHRVRVDGYIEVYYPAHPDAPKSGWMLQHRLVAEQSLGRRLLKSEHVHHINRVKDDNRPENLDVIDAGTHARITSANGAAMRKSEREELAEYRRRYGPLT